MPEPAAVATAEVFRLAVTPGVTPGKWIATWRDRLPDVRLELVPVTALDGGDVLRAGGADAGLVRLPFDRTALAAIPLYTEVPVVIVPTDHAIAAFDEIGVADLADEIMLNPLDDLLDVGALPGEPAAERPVTTGDAVELVAAGVGVLVVPQSLARLHHRRDLTYRPVIDGPGSQVALAWVEDRTSELVEELIGIVRGRTVRSSRGRAVPAPEVVAEQRVAKAGASKAGASRAAGTRAGGSRSGGGGAARTAGDGRRVRKPRGRG